MRAKYRITLLGAAAVVAGVLGYLALLDHAPGAADLDASPSVHIEGQASAKGAGASAARSAAAGSPARRVQVALPPVGAPAAVTVRTLLPVVSQSPQAACRVAYELTRCRVADAVLDIAMQDKDSSQPEIAKLIADLDAQTRSCNDIPGDVLDRTAELQRLAFYSGTPEVQRWVLKTYIAIEADGKGASRSRAVDDKLFADYVRFALQRRESDDLASLLNLYGTAAGLPGLRAVIPRNDAMFFALADIADQNGVSPGPFVEHLKRSTKRPDEASIARLKAQLSDRPWKPVTPVPPVINRSPLEDVLGMKPETCASASKA